MSTFLVWGIFKPLVNGFYKLIYGAVMLVFKALASTLDALTQLFFVFSGMTPVSSGFNAETGEVEQVDIVNYFLQEPKFQSAYLRLCLIALGLIIVFTIGRIIKQDYFDRSGPRSKGPIFRNVALSFIAFICIIPVFYFLVSACGALALAVMRAMGYEGGGIGTMLFNMSWSDYGELFQKTGVKILGKGQDVVDPNNFSWYPNDTFFHFYINEQSAEAWAGTESYGNLLTGTAGRPEFYWYICFFGSLILVLQLLKMILAMLSRIYKLIALFIVAPSPISQIVLDDGVKFKQWKDKVVQEGLKVVGCVMSFLLFIMIITSVDKLEITTFINTDQSAGAISLIDNNGITDQLSDINLLYYGGDTANAFDSLLNALGKMLLVLAGGGAIADIDSTISPFISGASSSMDAGNTGKSIMGVGAAVGGLAKRALNLVGQGVGAAAGGVAGAFGKRGLAREKAKDLLEEKTQDKKENKSPSGDGNSGGTTEGASNPTNMKAPQTPVNEGTSNPTSDNTTATPDTGTSEGATNPTGEGAMPDVGPDGAETSEKSAAASTPEGEDAAANPTSENKPEAPDKEKTDDKDKKEDSRPELTKKQRDAFVKSEGRKAFWKSIGGSLGKTAKKAPLKLLQLAGSAVGAAVGTTLRATGYGSVVDAVSGKGGMIENMKGAYAKHSGTSGKEYAAKKAAKKEAAENKAQEKRLDEFISNQPQKKDKSSLDAKSPTTPKASASGHDVSDSSNKNAGANNTTNLNSDVKESKKVAEVEVETESLDEKVNVDDEEASDVSGTKDISPLKQDDVETDVKIAEKNSAEKGTKKLKKSRGLKRTKAKQQPEIDRQLQTAYNSALNLDRLDKIPNSGENKKKRAAGDLIDYCEKMSSNCQMSLSDEDLKKAMESIDLSKVDNDVLSERNLESIDDYKGDLENRYNNAVKSYSDNINKAKEVAAQHKMSGKNNPELIQQIREALEQAYKDNVTINSIKVELKNVEKD